MKKNLVILAIIGVLGTRTVPKLASNLINSSKIELGVVDGVFEDNGIEYCYIDLNGGSEGMVLEKPEDLNNGDEITFLTVGGDSTILKVNRSVK